MNKEKIKEEEVRRCGCCKYRYGYNKWKWLCKQCFEYNQKTTKAIFDEIDKEIMIWKNRLEESRKTLKLMTNSKPYSIMTKALEISNIEWYIMMLEQLKKELKKKWVKE